jgi:hypothetical protein
MLLFEKKTTREMIAMLSKWRPSSFHVFFDLFDKPPKPVIETGIPLSGATLPAGVKANGHLSRRITP